MYNYKIAAYITAYEDTAAVERCIAAIQAQTYPVDVIFIIDNSRQNPLNSTLELPEISFEKIDSENININQTHNQTNIIIESHPENIGIAGGLERGIDWTTQKKYDFVWTFDQDSEPAPDALQILLDKYTQISALGEKIGIIAPLPIDVDSKQELHGALFQEYQRVLPADYLSAPEYYRCDIVITSGSLVNIEASKHVQIPSSELFIDAVDWLYCMNFRRQGYEIYVVKTAKMLHHLGVPRWVKSPIRKRDILIYKYSPLRFYYMHRNHTFAETRLAIGKKNKLKSIRRRLQTLRESMVNLLLYESQEKWLKIWACGRGTWEGLWGKLGKSW